MFHKILVALDRSDNSQKIFEEAIAFAKAAGATLMLLHVLSTDEDVAPKLPTMAAMEYYPIDGSFFGDYQNRWQLYEKQGLEFLRSLADQSAAAGITTEFTQNSGSPGRTICELARMWEADLIIVGRRGYSGLNELLLGSVSNYVLHHAPCSVLTIQGQPQANPAIAHDQPVAAES